MQIIEMQFREFTQGCLNQIRTKTRTNKKENHYVKNVSLNVYVLNTPNIIFDLKGPEEKFNLYYC